jgi:hypothetical protein
MTSKENVLRPPPGWADDSLTEFLENAHRNRFATFANKKDWYIRLANLDCCFVQIANDWLNPRHLLTPLFFLRCHSAFRAACEHAMAGQVTDAFPQIRVCLEYAGYALYIHKNPKLAEMWLKRHDSDAATKAVKNKFKVANVRATIEKANKHTAKVFAELYERAIDFGGHPNERSITGSLKITDLGDRKSFDSLYLHGNGLEMDHALRTTAQTGVCALVILQEAFPERFELLGVRAALMELRKGL